MKAHGSVTRESCPVCSSTAIIRNYWVIPFSRVEVTRVSGARMDQVPILSDDATIYIWALCLGCNSAFLDPHEDEREGYRGRKTHAAKIVDGIPIMEGGYLGRWKHISSFVKPEYCCLMDAACGAGQYLWRARDETEHTWKHAWGMEIAEPSVAEINKHASKKMWAKTGDLDAEGADLLGDDPRPDMIIFSEAFEHVEHPRVAMLNLTEILAPGGRMYLTAQSPTGDLPIRPGEPIYTTEKGLKGLLEELSLTIVDWSLSSGRWTAVVEK